MVSERKYVVSQILHRMPNITPELLRRRPQAANLMKHPHTTEFKFAISVHEFASKTYINTLPDGEFMVCPIQGKSYGKSIFWFSKKGHQIHEYAGFDELL